VLCLEVCCRRTESGNCKCYNPSVFEMRLVHIDALVASTFTPLWRFQFARPHQSTNRKFRHKVGWWVGPCVLVTGEVLVQTEVCVTRVALGLRRKRLVIQACSVVLWQVNLSRPKGHFIALFGIFALVFRQMSGKK
jgi:hypothetical protein